MENTRHSGSKGVALAECLNTALDKWRIRWDIQEGEGESVSFLEKDFPHKPTLEEVKAAVTDWHNGQIDRKILSGFTYEGTPVRLGMENQMNIKAAYDLAVQNDGAGLPVTFKFGTDTEPVYKEFADVGTFKAFYLSAMAYVRKCYTEGWQVKDSIDWDAYASALE